MEQNSQCWKKKRRIHVNTPLQNKWMEQSVSGMTQGGFVKVNWQTETGSEINLLCWCWQTETGSEINQSGINKGVHPRTSTIVQFIFYFGPLRSAIIFWEIRNKWLVKTHILDRFLFIWIPFWFMSVFESTACLKFAKLQYVSSGFRCRVIAGSLMRLY